MSYKGAQLQNMFARRREAEHNRIERTEAVNKYFDHWGKVTARFENWTTPDYYKRAEQQLEKNKEQKEKQKRLVNRQEKLTKLLELEKKGFELELQEMQKNKHLRRNVDTRTLERVQENLKELGQMKRKLELEAKLYGKWRHGVEDDNLLFESKSDNEVLAKLNWLDKQVDQQLQRETDEKAAKERELQLQIEINKSEELQKERQQIRENEIREIRCMQEHHLEQLKERQAETDELKQKENQLRENSNCLKKELDLLEESYAGLSRKVDFGDAHNLNKIKVFIRKRSETFRNQINLCLTILDRITDFAENPRVINDFKKCLKHQMEKEMEKLSAIEAMYESEAKYSLQRSEELWQRELTERYTELKQILIHEYRSINTSLTEATKKHEELLEIRATLLGIIENCSEKLKLLIQEEQHQDTNKIHSQLEDLEEKMQDTASNKAKLAAEPYRQDQLSSSDYYKSINNNMSAANEDATHLTSSFNHLGLDGCQTHSSNSQRDIESDRTNSQRSLQVVTPDTEADRPRFGRKRVAWN